MVLPANYTPEEIATHFGWSPRKLRALAREIGACSVVGNRMILTDKDVALLLEASRPKPAAIVAPAVGSYAELVKLRARNERRGRKP
jgi:hypothetical protein